LKALPLLLAALCVGATVAAIDTRARSQTVLQPRPSSVGQVSGDELGSLGLADAWLNSPPLTKAGLRGKVVLVQFWTYTCINWLRTAPYIRAWAEKYQDQGLVRGIGCGQPTPDRAAQGAARGTPRREL